jgi:hypothetical protein
MFTQVLSCTDALTSAHLEVITKGHKVGHVHLVKRGQHGVGVLGPLEALSYTCTQPGDLHTPEEPNRKVS